MVVKKTKQLGNFRRGINIYIPKRGQPITTYANGLYGKRYVGYFNDDVNWFNTATLHGDVNQLTQIDSFTNNAEDYSWQWVGYFKASSTENYTFYTSSDDASYLWIGNNTRAGFATTNANVNNGTTHAEAEVGSSPVSLVANTYYPIRVQFGESSGGDIMTVSFETPTIAKRTNGLGYYYYDTNTNGFSVAPVYPAWDGGTIYNIGDIVTHDGSNWICMAYAGAGYGPFGGFLDGTANGTDYWDGI